MRISKMVSCLSLLLIIIGALNWGLWGFFQFDIVAWLTKGNTNWAARLIYAIIGLAGVWSIGFLGKCKNCCGCGPECKCNDKSKGSGGGCCKM
jgi:uncharacterized protein